MGWYSCRAAQLGRTCAQHSCCAGEIPEDNDFQFVDWYPDSSRYPCCGYHCQTCPGGLGENADPYYCANNSPKGTSMWFYTWQDCDFIYATRNPDTYCNEATSDCAAYPEPDLRTRLTEMADAYVQFRGQGGNQVCAVRFAFC